MVAGRDRKDFGINTRAFEIELSNQLGVDDSHDDGRE